MKEKHAYVCPCCESNPADITSESNIIQMLCVKCGHIAIRKNQKKTLRIWNEKLIIKPVGKLPGILPIEAGYKKQKVLKGIICLFLGHDWSDIIGPIHCLRCGKEDFIHGI